MLRPGGRGEKSYTNGDGGLCVSGDKLRLLRIPKPEKCYVHRSVVIAAELTEEVGGQGRRKVEQRRPLKLNVTDYKNLQVCSDQLRRAREAVRVGEFERILRGLGACDGLRKRRHRDVLDTIRADEIYEEFFGRHYKHLQDIVSG